MSPAMSLVLGALRGNPGTRVHPGTTGGLRATAESGLCPGAGSPSGHGLGHRATLWWGRRRFSHTVSRGPEADPADATTDPTHRELAALGGQGHHWTEASGGPGRSGRVSVRHHPSSESH